MPVIISLEINDCSGCPFMGSKRHYTADSFEMVFDWLCKKNHHAVIATIEWNDPKPAIPAWCPLLLKKEKSA